MDALHYDLDPRVRRTREAIMCAFVDLIFERRYDAIRVADLIARASVGRATFYEHFRGKEEVLLAAMEPILLPLASAASRRATVADVRRTLDHIWHNRAMGRIVLGAAAGTIIQRRLAAMIAARLHDRADGSSPASIAATGAAAAQLAMLRMWIGGEASCSTETLARQMIACARLISEGAER